MVREVTVTGQNVEEAVQSALAQLEVTEEHVEVLVVENGKKGLFGLFGSRPAVVKVTVRKDPIEETKRFLADVSEKMGVDVLIEVKQDGKHVEFRLTGEKIALLIGKRGQTLNALQYLTQLFINRDSDQYWTIVVDAEEYRLRRKQTLEQLAKRLADKSVAIRKKVALEPMPSFERKIIHSILTKDHRINSHSEGKDPHRHIVIGPK
jgi:spoIIIJ-associated protein